MAVVNPRLPRIARLIEEGDVVCPAGCPARAGQAVLCRIEGAVIDARRNPSSLQAYCLGENRHCPTWRADKEATWAARRGALDEG